MGAQSDSGGGSPDQATRPQGLTCPPTRIAPPSADPVSILTAVQFGAYAAMFVDVSERFASAYEHCMRSVLTDTDTETGRCGNSDDASARD